MTNAMKTNTTLAQLDAGIAVCPFAKDRAISALVMRSERIEDVPNPAFPVSAYGDENDNPTAFVRNRRAGLAMRLHI